MTTCRHCERPIVFEGEGLYEWVDPEAAGDDVIWREVCDAHDTFVANHEPDVLGRRRRWTPASSRRDPHVVLRVTGDDDVLIKVLTRDAS